MNETLIQKFFNKDCTASEAAQVLAYLKHHPEVVERYVSKEEWDNLDTETNVSGETWDFLWQEIARKNKAISRIAYLKKMAVAACIIGLLGVGYFIITHQKELPVTAQTDQQQAQQKTIKNTISNKLRFTLQDGSVITLSPSSSVSFEVPFQNRKRDIQLNGEAYFKVAKDTSKPFTVYAGELATTAVGTAFSVSDKNGNTTVKLYEGKVKIHSTDAKDKLPKEAFLLPGQQLNYIAATNILAVHTITAPPTKPPAGKPLKQPKSFTLTDSTIQFTGQPLSTVLDKLNNYYSTQIEYNKPEIDTISFTGTISRTDSLNIILKVIAQMNGLTVQKQNDTLFIKKPKTIIYLI